MQKALETLEKIFFSDLIGGLDLYTIVASVLKFIFVIIVLYFVVTIVRMIYLDIRQTVRSTAAANTYIKLINRRDQFDFPVREIYYVDDGTTIGRGKGNSIVVNDPRLSKQHARFILSEGRFYLEDLNSTNGTRLNEIPVDQPTEIRNRDIISLGLLEFMFINRGEQ
ncbi:MAG TPA: FHA domain-containing protein [Clostridiales bacterium]|jgi:hypothetical protein|nr:FHA domain-containing protein [Clostridiales bacterium]